MEGLCLFGSAVSLVPAQDLPLRCVGMCILPLSKEWSLISYLGTLPTATRPLLGSDPSQPSLCGSLVQPLLSVTLLLRMNRLIGLSLAPPKGSSYLNRGPGGGEPLAIPFCQRHGEQKEIKPLVLMSASSEQRGRSRGEKGD